jgi:CheY-like chemotaxis protein
LQISPRVAAYNVRFVCTFKERAIVGIFDRLRSTFGKTVPEPTQDKITTAAPPVPPTAADRRNPNRRDARKGTRALIIDDSPTIVFALKKILRSSGFETLEALDAEKGVELARAEKPELIFLDIVLPGMNGFAALRLMRRDPITKDIPVIMISSNEKATEQFFGSRIGADDFMKKPFSRFEVFSRIERLLDEEMVPRRLTTTTEEQE